MDHLALAFHRGIQTWTLPGLEPFTQRAVELFFKQMLLAVASRGRIPYDEITEATEKIRWFKNVLERAELPFSVTVNVIRRFQTAPS